jgi:hypothetical protein
VRVRGESLDDEAVDAHLARLPANAHLPDGSYAQIAAATSARRRPRHLGVLAVNTVYDPAGWRMSQTVLPQLRFLPTDFARRITAALEGPSDAVGARRSAGQREQRTRKMGALARTLGVCEGGSWP